VRQIKRLCRAWRVAGGARALVSRRRGAPSNRRIAPELRERVLHLVRSRYAGFGPTLAAEYLAEEHGIELSRETLRQWMLAAGLWRSRRVRRRRAYQLRARRACVGELVQIDGSPHAWLEERGPRCTLIVFVDDATGRIGYARFEPAESTAAYLRALRAYVGCHGVPAALYSDRHSIFTKHDPEDPIPTQFERAARSLGIEPILALTPQAKGRVERSFQTLQDRLVKALRLAGACTIETANALLPAFVQRYDARFGRRAASPENAHRPAPEAERLRRATCEQFERTLSRALSCQCAGVLYQIDTAGEPAYGLRGAKVTVCHDPQGAPVTILRGDQALAHRPFERAPSLATPRVADDKSLESMVDLAVQAARSRRSRALGQANSANPAHPWRRDKTAAAERAARSGGALGTHAP
jgi:hypothetical protein